MAVLAACLTALVARGAATANEELRLTCFRFRHGEATLVSSPDGQKLLIGCGGPGDGDALVRELKHRGISTIGTLIIATWAEHHVGDADSLMERLHVRAVLFNPLYIESPRNRRFYEHAKRLGQAERLMIGSPSPGEERILYRSPPCLIRMSAPTGPMLKRYANDPACSLVMEVNYGRCSVLLMGDTRRRHQQSMWSSAPIRPDADVVVVANPDGPDALDPALVKKWRTTRAVFLLTPGIDSGASTPGTRRLLAAVRAMGVRCYDTAATAIEIRCDGNATTVSRAPQTAR